MKGAQGYRPFCSAPVARLLAAALLSVSAAWTATPIQFSGELGGVVNNAAGQPQPGAVVLLFNKQDQLLLRSATDAAGRFAFSELLPDLYNLQVSLASYIPAAKDAIQIRAGMRSLLEINLSRVVSSIQLVATIPAPNGLMSDDWKWSLRTATASRPILRLLPVARRDPDVAAANATATAESRRPAIFTDSRGLIRISASDGAPAATDGQADLGTQFAFATSVYGGNHLAVAGDVGNSASGNQSTAFRTTFSREIAGVRPELAVTMRQFFIPMRVGQSLIGGPAGDSSVPTLRTLGVSFGDRAQLSEELVAEYGFELTDVSFVDRIHYVSPWARLNRSLPHGKLDLTWTSGNARPELGVAATDANADLQRDLTALALMPRVSLMEGRARVQRTDNYELGVTQRFGTREYRVSGYYEDVANAALTLVSPAGGLFPGNLLPDMISNAAVFDYGRLTMFGYSAAATQNFGDFYRITLIYGAPGALTARSGEGIGSAGIGSTGIASTGSASADNLRHELKPVRREALTLRASGTVKCTGLRFVASYQWTSRGDAMPGPAVSTEASRPDPGFNILLRQPMPSIPGVKGRIEASAELRNILAQGYLAMTTPGGDPMLLVNNPRSFRGGVAYVF